MSIPILILKKRNSKIKMIVYKHPFWNQIFVEKVKIKARITLVKI